MCFCAYLSIIVRKILSFSIRGECPGGVKCGSLSRVNSYDASRFAVSVVKNSKRGLG